LSCGIGDAAEIRTQRVRKQKTNRQDAQLILRLLVEDRFPRSGCQVGSAAISATAVASASHGAGAHGDTESKQHDRIALSVFQRWHLRAWPTRDKLVSDIDHCLVRSRGYSRVSLF
jgi:hypothetical protein